MPRNHRSNSYWRQLAANAAAMETARIIQQANALRARLVARTAGSATVVVRPLHGPMMGGAIPLAEVLGPTRDAVLRVAPDGRIIDDHGNSYYTLNDAVRSTGGKLAPL